jgi:hypothetical protein
MGPVDRDALRAESSPMSDTGFMVGLVLLASVALALAILTGLGAHRRGLTIPLPALVGLVFPATWTVWYLRDQHPYRRANRHTA